ncbi:MAG: S24 family peptidase [Oscillospiraceae bacterium]
MIGSTLKKLLAQRGMSVNELSRRVGVPAQTLYSIIKRDNMKIDFDTLLRICAELDAPMELFCSGAGVSAVSPDLEEWELLRRWRELDEHGRKLTRCVMDAEWERVHRETARTDEEKIIPLYFTPAAAGYASPALGEDYEDYAVPAASRADFAARIQGDSMEPVIHDGSVVLVERCPIDNGDVGLFFVDGDMKCKQYCRDNYGNVYLLSLNRERADADVTISASSGVTVCCFGRVILDRRPPLPVR